ncbi:TIGR00730 family Rossman fold protein [Dysgonomonas sp. BGC7]|uniref:LOG family protein n=1 Tax=Dysgonomonas sp. BGC7 TaxID=1658008 RepID=UPI0006808B2A|nr:TIGR00730 family Rossman fold protein [Dysgonomonas sp. BGC7]MBD8390127.1 TIGR00730 family Rossman fold protein [Dysgonomonas sp. BGC7]
MKNISIFCGSSSGNEGVFVDQAAQLGHEIAERGYGLVYGGARVGLMGAVAGGALSNGGKVIGVIPDFLKKKELELKDVSEMHVVDTMHERKALMNELSDGVIALPGGYGTLEELFEMLTWAQLALHKKPVGLLNVEGYYDALIEMSSKMIDKGFLKEEYRELLIVDDDIDLLLNKMEDYIPPANDKWFETK